MRPQVIRLTNDEWETMATKLAVVIPELYDRLAKTPTKNWKRGVTLCQCDYGGSKLIVMFGRDPAIHTVPSYAAHQLHCAVRRAQGWRKDKGVYGGETRPSAEEVSARQSSAAYDS